jgi:hypothetical protein
MTQKKERWNALTAKLPRQICPVCKVENDAATSTTLEVEKFPKEGDISICGSCAALSVYTSDLKLIELTTDEFIDLPLDERSHLKAAQNAVIEYIEFKKTEKV